MRLQKLLSFSRILHQHKIKLGLYYFLEGFPLLCANMNEWMNQWMNEWMNGWMIYLPSTGSAARRPTPFSVVCRASHNPARCYARAMAILSVCLSICHVARLCIETAETIIKLVTVIQLLFTKTSMMRFSSAESQRTPGTNNITPYRSP